MSSPLEILKSNAVFQGFDSEALRIFVQNSKVSTFAAGDVIFKEMSPGKEILLILDGRVSVQSAGMQPNQPPVEITTMGPGEIVGEVSFIEIGPRSAAVVAETSVKALLWQSSDLRTLCEQNPDMGYRFVLGIARLLCTRIRRTNIQVALLNKILWGAK